jgi:hypothetical protein
MLRFAADDLLADVGALGVGGNAGSVLTLWASTTQAGWFGGASSRSRTIRCRWRPNFSMVPSAVQALK